MATNFLWGAVGSVMNLLTSTEMDSLASGSGTVYGSEVGSVNDIQMCMLAFHVASSSSAFTSASCMQLCFVSPIDTASGSTYPTYTSGSSYKLATSNYLSAVLYVNPATQSSNVVDETMQFVSLPLGYFKTIAISALGVTLPSSGNTLKAFPTPSQY